MQSARGCIQLEKTAKDAEGARRGMTRRSSREGSMFGDARMQLLNPEEQACMQLGASQPNPLQDLDSSEFLDIRALPLFGDNTFAG